MITYNSNREQLTWWESLARFVVSVLLGLMLVLASLGVGVLVEMTVRSIGTALTPTHYNVTPLVKP